MTTATESFLSSDLLAIYQAFMIYSSHSSSRRHICAHVSGHWSGQIDLLPKPATKKREKRAKKERLSTVAHVLRETRHHPSQPLPVLWTLRLLRLLRLLPVSF